MMYYIYKYKGYAQFVTIAYSLSRVTLGKKEKGERRKVNGERRKVKGER